MKKASLVFIAIALVLLSCSLPAKLVDQTPTPIPEDEIQPPSVVLLARQALADELGIDTGRITIEKFETAAWEDTCLELPAAGETCQPAPTDGYLVIFKASGQEYVYHTDTESQFRREAQLTWSEAAMQSRQLLAALLGYSPDSVEIISEQSVKFPDTCLNIHISAVACANILTAGTVITLKAGENTYTFHSALDPVAPVLAEVTGVSTNVPVITWSRQGQTQNICDDLQIYLSGWAVQYSCRGVTGAEPGVISLTPARQRQLLRWLLEFRPFEYQQTSLDGVSVRMVFLGSGKADPGFEDQKRMSEFAAGILAPPATLVPTPVPTLQP